MICLAVSISWRRYRAAAHVTRLFVSGNTRLQAGFWFFGFPQVVGGGHAYNQPRNSSSKICVEGRDRARDRIEIVTFFKIAENIEVAFLVNQCRRSGSRSRSNRDRHFPPRSPKISMSAFFRPSIFTWKKNGLLSFSVFGTTSKKKGYKILFFFRTPHSSFREPRQGWYTKTK